MATRVLIVDPSVTGNRNPMLASLYLNVHALADETNILNYRALLRSRALRRYLREEFTHIVISGSALEEPSIDQRQEDIMKAFSWVKTSRVPCLGICAGHQIIGMLFGSTLVRHTQCEKGFVPLVLEDAAATDPLLAEFSGFPQVESTHKDAITLPRSFRLLASTRVCGTHAMKDNRKPLYGFQSHIELSPDGLRILANFLKLPGHRA